MLQFWIQASSEAQWQVPQNVPPFYPIPIVHCSSDAMTNTIQVDPIFLSPQPSPWPSRHYKLFSNKCLSPNPFFISYRMQRSSSVTSRITSMNMRYRTKTATCRSEPESDNCVSIGTSSWPSSCLKCVVPWNDTCKCTVDCPTSTSTFSGITSEHYVFPMHPIWREPTRGQSAMHDSDQILPIEKE